MQSPVLAIADQDRPFHVVCDASDFSIGCALMQYDTDGAERVVCYQSRQLQPAKRNYPMHEKESFRVHLLTFEKVVNVALNAEFNFKAARYGT